MTTQFEFHLSGAPTPDGEMEADHLLAVVASLKEVATRISRVETEAERLGRAPKRTQRVARLLIGLEPGSTRLLARRAGAGDGALEFDLADEQTFDEKFATVVESIADNTRPPWVDDSLAAAAADLTSALKQAAPEVEFKVAGEQRRRFATASAHRDVWLTTPGPTLEEVVFVGRLFAVNLKTHRLQVQDDVGNRVALPKVVDDAVAGRLLNTYVSVTGAPEYDLSGQLAQIHEAVIRASEPVLVDAQSADVSLDDILTGAPGVEPGGIGLTEVESDEFFAAIEPVARRSRALTRTEL